MRSSWEVLKQDRELLLFPLFSGICCLLVLASFAMPMFATGTWQPPGEEATQAQRVVYYVILFLFYFCNYFVILFFNSAVVACAVFRMRGGDPTLSHGFNAALSRLPQILGWALVSATVSLVLRIIENSNRKAGRFVAGFLGMGWSLVTFLVVPIFVVERKGPIEAFKESARLLKKTWGQQLIGNFSFGIVFLVLGLLGIIPLALSAVAPVVALKVVLIVVAVLYWLLLALIQSTLQTIFQAALYLYAHEGTAPRGFDPATLSGAMSRG